MKNYDQIIAYVRDMPWAIRPSMLAVILDLIRYRAEGGELTPEEIRVRLEAAEGRSKNRSAPIASGGAVAVINIFGPIVQHADLFAEVSGMVSTDGVTRLFREAMGDPNVKGVVFNIDSPGGGVYGVGELATEIRDTGADKPIVAVANSQMASAAYYIGSAADEVVVTPGGEVGSIGVFMAHQDLSVALEQEGVKVTLISAGKYKTEANPFAPLTDEAKAALQKTVNAYYEAFVSAVADGRGVKRADVRAGFGQGRMVTAKEAVSLGMADRIETLDETIDRVARGGFRRKNKKQQFGFDLSRLSDDATETETYSFDAPIDWSTAEAEEEEDILTPEEDAALCEEYVRLDEEAEKRHLQRKRRRLRFELEN